MQKNPLYDYFNPLKEDFKTEVAVIGSGITGALVAHELCSAGFSCCVIDKRGISQGSSVASTALLQYEIDTPLSQLSEMMGEDLAVKAYSACLKSISDLKKVFGKIKYNPDFEQVPSVYYASNYKGHKLIKKEFAIREKHNLPVNYLKKRELFKRYGFEAPGALENTVSAQIDTYAASTHILDYHMKNSYLSLFTNTEVSECNEIKNGYELIVNDKAKVICKYVVIACGFESGKFLPKPVMKLTSTYVIISEPVAADKLWKGKALIWETKDPYVYIRTTADNRIMVGGEDEDFRDPVKRDRLLRRKVEKLEMKIKKLFPSVPFVTSMAWCGTFSSTTDGLPYIGNIPGNNRMLYALGYGGNGITFSMIAAQMIRNKLEGKPDDREEIFGFERVSSDY